MQIFSNYRCSNLFSIDWSLNHAAELSSETFWVHFSTPCLSLMPSCSVHEHYPRYRFVISPMLAPSKRECL